MNAVTYKRYKFICDYLIKNYYSSRVELRYIDKNDKADYFELFNDKESNHNSGLPLEMSEEYKLNRLNEAINLSGYFELPLGIFYKENNKLIGTISIADRPYFYTHEKLKNLKGLGLSFMLNSSYQRKGIMSEVLREVLSLLKREELHLDFINAGYYSYNEGSKILQEKMGFKPLFEAVLDFNGERRKVIECFIFNK